MSSMQARAPADGVRDWWLVDPSRTTTIHSCSLWSCVCHCAPQRVASLTFTCLWFYPMLMQPRFCPRNFPLRLTQIVSRQQARPGRDAHLPRTTHAYKRHPNLSSTVSTPYNMKTIFDTAVSSSAFGIALFLIQLSLVLVYLRRKSSQFATRSAGRPLPPGPPGIPILGNLFDLPKRSPWLGYRELSRRYGTLSRTFSSSVVKVFRW